jgi:predicted CoA-substrate-specific enzyme activase
MYYRAGLDIGSYRAKAIIMDKKDILSFAIMPVSGGFYQAAHQVLKDALDKCGLQQNQLDIIGVTGLGSSFLSFPAIKNTEVSCQSRGIKYLLPTARLLIDIGDQASRIIKLSEQGKVADCVINDRCATGSGRILRIIARVLQLGVQEMGALSQKATHPVRFSTGCAVFAETEAISRIAEGSKVEDIVAGLHQAIALKIFSMTQKVKIEGNCAITGGGAKDIGLVKMLAEIIGQDLLVADEPLISGAIGAALMATEN